MKDTSTPFLRVHGLNHSFKLEGSNWKGNLKELLDDYKRYIESPSEREAIKDGSQKNLVCISTLSTKQHFHESRHDPISNAVFTKTLDGVHVEKRPSMDSMQLTNAQAQTFAMVLLESMCVFTKPNKEIVIRIYIDEK